MKRKVFAIGDLHLSFGVAGKSMEVFGAKWHDHENRVKRNWEAKVSDDDLVLIPGDISWAKYGEEALADLKWIDSLPGTKVMIKGNHDYWWQSLAKVNKLLPSSLHAIQNSVFTWNDLSIGGSRLWDSPEYNFNEYIPMVENPFEKESEETYDKEENARVFERELKRLELSLQGLNQKAPFRIAMTHYPPIGADLNPSHASFLFEKYNVQFVVFGHLHNVTWTGPLFGTARGVTYIYCACDYINCDPVRLL